MNLNIFQIDTLTTPKEKKEGREGGREGQGGRKGGRKISGKENT